MAIPLTAEKVGILLLPAPLDALGPLSIPAALFARAARAPRLRGRPHRPALLEPNRAGLGTALFLALLLDADTRAASFSLAGAENLLLASVVLCAGLGVTVTAIPDLRRRLLPLLTVPILAWLAHGVSEPIGEAGRAWMRPVTTSRQRPRRGASAGHLILVEDPQEALALGPDPSVLLSRRLAAGGPDRRDPGAPRTSWCCRPRTWGVRSAETWGCVGVPRGWACSCRAGCWRRGGRPRPCSRPPRSWTTCPRAGWARSSSSPRSDPRARRSCASRSPRRCSRMRRRPSSGGPVRAGPGRATGTWVRSVEGTFACFDLRGQPTWLLARELTELRPVGPLAGRALELAARPGRCRRARRRATPSRGGASTRGSGGAGAGARRGGPRAGACAGATQEAAPCGRTPGPWSLRSRIPWSWRRAARPAGRSSWRSTA